MLAQAQLFEQLACTGQRLAEVSLRCGDDMALTNLRREVIDRTELETSVCWKVSLAMVSSTPNRRSNCDA